MRIKFTPPINIGRIFLALILCLAGVYSNAQRIWFEGIPSGASVPDGWKYDSNDWSVSATNSIYRFQPKNKSDLWIYSNKLDLSSKSKIKFSLKAGYPTSATGDFTASVYLCSDQNKTIVSTFTGSSSQFDSASDKTKFNKTTVGNSNQYAPTTELTFETEIEAGSYYIGVNVNTSSFSNAQGSGVGYINLVGLTATYENDDSDPDPGDPWGDPIKHWGPYPDSTFPAQSKDGDFKGFKTYDSDNWTLINPINNTGKEIWSYRTDGGGNRFQSLATGNTNKYLFTPAITITEPTIINLEFKAFFNEPNGSSMEVKIGNEQSSSAMTNTIDGKVTASGSVSVPSGGNKFTYEVNEPGIYYIGFLNTSYTIICLSDIAVSLQTKGSKLLPTGIKVKKDGSEIDSSLSLTVKDNISLSAVIVDDEGKEMSNETTYSYTTSNNDGVINLTEAGVISALKAGTATVTVTAEGDGFTLTKDITVTVENAKANGISFGETTEITLKRGETGSIKAVVTPDDAVYELEWTVEGPAGIISGDDQSDDQTTYEFTALKEGEVTVKATVKDNSALSASCKVTVEPKYTISLSRSEAQVNVSQSKDGDDGSELEAVLTLTATLDPTVENANIEWSVDPSDESILRLVKDEENPGTINIIALQEGSAIVTANYEDATAACVVNVVPAGYLSGWGPYPSADTSHGEYFGFKTHSMGSSNLEDPYHNNGWAYPNWQLKKGSDSDTKATFPDLGVFYGKAIGPSYVNYQYLYTPEIKTEGPAIIKLSFNAAGNSANAENLSVKIGKDRSHAGMTNLMDGTVNFAGSIDVPSGKNSFTFKTLEAGTYYIGFQNTGTSGGISIDNIEVSVYEVELTDPEEIVFSEGVTDGKYSSETLLKIGDTGKVTVKVEPSDADYSLEWSVNGEAITGSADATDKNTFNFTAKNAGTATITATVKDHPELKAECEVSVYQLTLNINKKTTSVGRNDLKLIATFTPSLDDAEISWSSNNESVATVVDGQVTALSEGVAEITASYQDFSAVCTVTVNPKGHVWGPYPNDDFRNDKSYDYEGFRTYDTNNTDLINPWWDYVTLYWYYNPNNNGNIQVPRFFANSGKTTLDYHYLFTPEIVISEPSIITVTFNAFVNDGGELKMKIGTERNNESMSEMTGTVVSGGTGGNPTGVNTFTYEALSAGTYYIGFQNNSTASISINNISVRKEAKEIVDPKSIKFAEGDDNLILAVNDEGEITVEVTPENASYTLRWSFDNSVIESQDAIAGEDNTFKFKAIKAGKTTVTATILENDNLKADCEISVYELTVSRDNINVAVNESYQLNARLNPAEPDHNLYWESLNLETATVDQSGKVTGVAAGSTTINVYYDENHKDIVSSCLVNVGEYRIELDRTAVSLSAGGEIKLNATVVNGTDDTVVTWNSSNPSVATVSDKGLVKAIAEEGSTVITASCDKGISATCIITISEEAVIISHKSVNLTEGDSHQFYVDILPENMSPELFNVTWKSSNPDIVEITEDGMATVKSDGASAAEKSQRRYASADDKKVKITATITMTVEDMAEILIVDQLTNVEETFGNKGPVDIYTLDGICLFRNAEIDDIKTLSPGIYVIGGKKYLLN